MTCIAALQTPGGLLMGADSLASASDYHFDTYTSAPFTILEERQGEVWELSTLPENGLNVLIETAELQKNPASSTPART